MTVLHPFSLSKQAVCCEDKLHCCPEGSTCDMEHNKCVHPETRKETPMWAKLPARIRAEWENQKGVMCSPQTYFLIPINLCLTRNVCVFSLSLHSQRTHRQLMTTQKKSLKSPQFLLQKRKCLKHLSQQVIPQILRINHVLLQ